MMKLAGNLLRALGVTLLTVALAACNPGDSSSTAATDSAPATSMAASAPQARSAATPSDSTSSSSDPISFAAALYSVSQGQGSVSLRVQRTGPAGSAVSVSYSTSNGTAIAGTHYTRTSGTLHWTENDTTPATITIPISTSHPFSGSKTFQVALTNPSSGTKIISPGTAIVSISGSANESAGSLRLSSSSYTVAQASGSLTVTVDRMGGANGAVSVEYWTRSGTATAGKNFTASRGILEWADGNATAKTFTVPIAHTTGFSGDEMFHVALGDARSGASLGTPNDAVVTIIGEGGAASDLALSSSAYSVSQRAGSVTITADRKGSSAGSVSVEYSTSSGTAVAGRTYTSKSGTLQWASGDTTPKKFSVAISDSSPFAGNKTFTVALSNPSTDATIVTPGKATVTVVGSGGGAVGSLALSGSAYTVSQGGGSLTVTVDRTGGFSGAATVNYATSNGSAVAGTDYTAANGTLRWADGDATPKRFAIPISDARPFSGKKSFGIALSRASGATLSTPSTATASINGDATAATGSLQFSSGTYGVPQSAGDVTVTVNRTGGSAGSISVGYSTSNGTADAGSGYTATSGTLDWADGNSSSKTVRVPISAATPFAGTKTFKLALSDPTSGATLGSPSGTTVMITGSGGQGSAPSAPDDLTLVNQGGPGDNDGFAAGPLTHYQAIEWTAATAGANPIDHYRIYRNGNAYATISAPTVFQGFIIGKILTVTSVTSGTIIPGARWSGTGVPAGTMINASQLTGAAGGVGTYPVNVSSAGSAGSPITFRAWVFIDDAATASNDPNTATQATSYSYAVSAVDTAGNEGSQTTQYSAYGYQDGFSNWENENYDYGGGVSIYNSTAGNPQDGLYDFEANLLGGGGVNPVAGAPQAPLYDLEIGAFKYYTVDINPGPNVGYQIFLSHLSRVPPGDVYGWNGVNNVFAYGPAPVANTWATYKIPLTALGIGRCTITASISGSKLTVTSVDSGPAIVDAGGYVTGPGIPSGTYITAYGQAGAIGTFTIAGPGINASTRVASETMNYARTAFYKSTIQPSANVAFYMNNMGWTEK